MTAPAVGAPPVDQAPRRRGQPLLAFIPWYILHPDHPELPIDVMVSEAEERDEPERDCVG